LNIDLLFTNDGEGGLVSDEAFDTPIAGIMFDLHSCSMSIEFSDMESLELNIPIEETYINALIQKPILQVGVIENGEMQTTMQVPLMYLNAPPYMSQSVGSITKSSNSVVQFDSFLKRCNRGQPLHRSDLDDDESTGSVMGGMSTALVEYAPHLSRQRTVEVTQQMSPNSPGPKTPTPNVPTPNMPGMSVPGGGGARGIAPPPAIRGNGENPSGKKSGSGKKEDER